MIVRMGSHVASIRDMRNAYQISSENLTSMRQCEDITKIDLKEMECWDMDWIKLAW